MKSRKYSAKHAETGSGSEGFSVNQRNVSTSSASAQSESSPASRNFFFDDNTNTSTPRSKRDRQRTNSSEIVMTSSGVGHQRPGGSKGGRALNVQADIESGHDGRILQRMDQSAGRAHVNTRESPTSRDGLPLIVVDGVQGDSGVVSIEDGKRRRGSAVVTTNNTHQTKHMLLTKSERNVIAAEMAYQSSPYQTQPATATRQRRRSKDLLHRSYEQTYEGRVANGAHPPEQRRKSSQRNDTGLSKIEGTAAELVEDAIEKALEAIYGKKKTSTMQTNVGNAATATSTTVESSTTTNINANRNYERGSSSRIVRSVVDDIRDEDMVTKTSYTAGRSRDRRRSSSSPRPSSAAARRSTDRLRNDKRYDSSEWYSSDCYLSPVQGHRNHERNTFVVGNSVDRSATRRTSGYASDTALFSPPPLSLPRLMPSSASSVQRIGDVGGWRSASTDSDFSTTLEIRNKNPSQRQPATANVDVRSLDRYGNRQRQPRPVTLTKGMVTKVIHGMVSEHTGRDLAVTSQSQDGSRLNSLQSAAISGGGLTSPPPGINVLSIPTVYTGNHHSQSTSYGMRPLDVDVVDHHAPSAASTMSSSRAYLTSSRTTFASPPSADYEVTSAVKVRQATDQRVDLLVNPGKQRQQHPKVRVFGAGTTVSNGDSSAGLPAIAEYNMERRVASAMSSATATNAYSAYSNEPIFVADLLGQEVPPSEWSMRKTHSLDELRTSPLQTVVDEWPSGNSMYSTSATKPNINMSSGQVLNMYLFGRPRSVDLPPVSPRDLERPTEVETLTRSIMFSDDKHRGRLRKPQNQSLPVRHVIDDKETQTTDVRSRRVETTRPIGKNVGTMTKPMSTTAVQTERKVERQLSPVIIEQRTTKEYLSNAPHESAADRKKKETRQTKASNVTEQTIFVRPNFVETRQMEMTGDVFASRPSRSRDYTDDGRQMPPVVEMPVVMQSKPNNDSTHVEDFFARESQANKNDKEEEDEDIMMETEVIEEKQQRIEMTIREDIEFSLQRTQGQGKPSMNGEDSKRTNIEPWWIPPTFKAFVDRKKQKITQIKEIENTDDYLKKTDHSNETAHSPVGSFRRDTSRDYQPTRYDDEDDGGDDDGGFNGYSTNDVTNTSERGVDIPVCVEKPYLSPVLELPNSGVRSSPLYGRTTSVERRTGSPKRRVASPDRRSTSNTIRVDVEQPSNRSQKYVTSYTKYISPPSPTTIVWNRNSNTFDEDQPPTSMQSRVKNTAVGSAVDVDDVSNLSSRDAQQRPPWSSETSVKVTSTITPKTYGFFPKTKITLPVTSAERSPTSTLRQSVTNHRKSTEDDDDGDRLPDSLDHFDRMLSHLEREILTTNVDDDQQQGRTTPGRSMATSDRKLVTSRATPQQPDSESNTPSGKIKPPPPPPLKKSWKVEAFSRNQNAHQPPRSKTIDAERPQSTSVSEHSFRQQLADRNTIIMNLMDHSTQQPQQQSAENMADGGYLQYDAKPKGDAWFDSDLARNSSALQSPAFVSSSWKSLERRHRADIGGTERMAPHDAAKDADRREPNGYETMITAL